MRALDFFFDDRYLSDMGYIVCTLDGQETIKKTSVSKIEYSTVKTPNRSVWNRASSADVEPLTTTIQILKLSCEDETVQELTSTEIGEMTRWLCRADKYCEFSFVQDGYEDIFYNVKIDLDKIDIYGITSGFELTITSDKPYGYTKENINSIAVTPTSPYIIYDTSDVIGYTYPDTLTIVCNEAGDLTLTNSIDSRVTQIKGCVNNEVITINGKTLQISSSVLTHDIANDFNYIFPRISNKKDTRENIISTNKNCSLTISWSVNRKVGL